MPSPASVNELFTLANDLQKNKNYANKNSDNVADNNADSTRELSEKYSVNSSNRYVCDSNTSLSSSAATFTTEDAKYVVMLVHEGATQSNLVPLPSLGRFYQCVTDEEEFAVLPERTMIDRNCVYVRGRENTMHVAELMHLISLEP